jgi:hypothetical protein
MPESFASISATSAAMASTQSWAFDSFISTHSSP